MNFVSLHFPFLSFVVVVNYHSFDDYYCCYDFCASILTAGAFLVAFIITMRAIQMHEKRTNDKRKRNLTVFDVYSYFYFQLWCDE